MSKPDTPQQRKMDTNLLVDKHTLLDALKDIRDDGDMRDRRLGVCDCVSTCGRRFHSGANAMGTLSRLMGQWPESQGRSGFPVPGWPGPLTAYDAARKNGTMWDESTGYGQARWRLLHWLISKLEQELGVTP